MFSKFRHVIGGGSLREGWEYERRWVL